VAQLLADCETRLQQLAADQTEPDDRKAFFERGYIERTEEFWRSIRVLQRLADMVCAKDVLRDLGDLRFCGFTFRDVETLQRVTSRGEAVERHHVRAAKLGQELGWIYYGDPGSQGCLPVPPDQEVDLCITTAPPLPSEGVTTEDHFIWEVMDRIARAGHHDEPALRKCRMPQGIERHLDFLLGVRGEDVPECGTYYIAQRNAHTCGRERCRKAYRRLRNDEAVGKAKAARAEALAWQLWPRASRRGDFYTLWDETGRDFLHFRELLEERTAKGPT